MPESNFIAFPLALPPAGALFTMVAKVPPPVVVHCPLPLVVALMFTGALLQAVKVPVMDAVAGAFTVSVAVTETGWQGPLPSGSAVVQVRVMLPGLAFAGVKVVLALVGLPNVPAPAGADQVPASLDCAATFTGSVPHVT